MSYQRDPAGPPPFQPPTPSRRPGGWSPGRFSPAIALVALVVIAILVGAFYIARRGGADATPTAGVVGQPVGGPSGAPSAGTSAASSVAPVSSAPRASASSASTAAEPKVFAVGNTDGDGVFLRRTPVLADRDTAYPDGTLLTAIGADVTAEGELWHHVRAPDGKTGYVPAKYTVDPPQ